MPASKNVYNNASKYIIAIVSCLISFTKLQSQTSLIDSLKYRLSIQQSDRLTTLLALCWQGESLPSDSFLMYAREAKELSIKNNDRTSRLEADFFMARRFNYLGKPDSALKICTEDMPLLSNVKNSYSIYHSLWWSKIVALTKLRKIDESLKECYQLLESGEKYNDTRAQVIALTNIGVNYNVLRNRPEAMRWFQKAYHLTQDTTVYKNYSLVVINLATYYFLDNKLDSAGYLLNKAFEYALENQNLRSEADCFTLKAQLYGLSNKPDSAEKMLQQAVVIEKRLGYVQFILVGLNALESFYCAQKNFTKAIGYIKEAEQYSKEFHEPLTLSFYQDLAECYRQLGSYKSSAEALDTLMELKDSLYQKSRAEDLAQLEAQYELTNKEAYISKQKLELLHKDIWMAGIAVITLLVLSMAYFLFRRNKHRHKIAVRQAEENERKRIAADLHDNIGAYASAISAGIDEIENKKLITDAVAVHHLKNNATEIITSLRDTIWALDKESITLTGIADRMKSYITKMQPAYPSIMIEMEENIMNEKKLSPVSALNIFRIFQEALHNALEHSHGSKIVINVHTNDGLSVISIRDNGDGFDLENAFDSGNGLTNMQNRASEAGFDLSFEKSSPQGTKVTLAIKDAGPV